eukprot:scaffold12565_cov121-Isochrysis_galbana.AAC.9
MKASEDEPAMALLRPETRPTSFSQSVRRARGYAAGSRDAFSELPKGKKSAPPLSSFLAEHLELRRGRDPVLLPHHNTGFGGDVAPFRRRGRRANVARVKILAQVDEGLKPTTVLERCGCDDGSMTSGAVARSLDALVGRRSLGPDEVRGSRQLGKLKSSSPSTMSITMGEREDMRSETSRPEEQDTRAAVPDEPNAAGVIEGCSGGEKRNMAGLGWIVLAPGAETDGGWRTKRGDGRVSNMWEPPMLEHVPAATSGFWTRSVHDRPRVSESALSEGTPPVGL